MRIALAQLSLSDAPSINKDNVLSSIERGAKDGVDLMVFPEATMKAFGTGRLDTTAEELDGEFATDIARAAAKARMTVVLGMFRPADVVERDGKTRQRVFNTLLCAGPELGTAGYGVGADTTGDFNSEDYFIEHYDKIHLFDAFGFRESDTVAPGSGQVVVDIPVRSRSAVSVRSARAMSYQPAEAEADNRTEEIQTVTIGLATCFDVRFPEHFVELAQLGAEVIALPTSWNDGPGKREQWRILTAARALDSTCYLVATGAARPGGAAKAGKPEGPTGIGHSVLVGPEGDARISAGYEPQLLIADIDVDDLDRVRKEIPILTIRSGECD